MINSCVFLFSFPGFHLSHFVSFISNPLLPRPPTSLSAYLPHFFLSVCLCLFQSIIYYFYLTQWNYFFLSFFVHPLPISPSLPPFLYTFVTLVFFFYTSRALSFCRSFCLSLPLSLSLSCVSL